MLVNNAGLGGETPVVDMTDEQWDRVLDITLTSTFRATRAALRPDRPCCSTIAAARPRSSGPTRGISLAAGPLAFRTLPRETIRQA